MIKMQANKKCDLLDVQAVYLRQEGFAQLFASVAWQKY